MHLLLLLSCTTPAADVPSSRRLIILMMLPLVSTVETGETSPAPDLQTCRQSHTQTTIPADEMASCDTADDDVSKCSLMLHGAVPDGN